MPELPEVETIRRELEASVVGLRIVDAEVPIPRVLRLDPDEFIRRVKGTTVIGAERRAKILILHLSSGDALLFHLMIAGSLLYRSRDVPRLERTQVVLVFDNGYELRYRDLRLFGYVKLLSGPDVLRAPELSHLGPEPLSDDFTLDLFEQMIARRPRANIKSLLMNQSFIAGIGNIYADEILYFARIHPGRRAGSLTEQEVERLYEGIREVLAEAVRERGSSIASYADIYGKEGNYHNLLKVYGRTGEPCPEDCGGTVVKTKIAGRGTHLCPQCQK